MGEGIPTFDGGEKTTLDRGEPTLDGGGGYLPWMEVTYRGVPLPPEYRGAEGVLTTRQAVCLLCSRGRTFLFPRLFSETIRIFPILNLKFV